MFTTTTDDNQGLGTYLYTYGDEETRQWFAKQWKMWPERADERLTTNLSLHYGGVVAFRAINSSEPEMSDQFREGVRVLDRFAASAAKRQENG